MNVFIRHAFASAIVAAALVASSAGTASAQTIGTFPFRLQPFCNNALLTVTQEGTTYRLAGWDDNCGSGNERFPLTGTISPNNDGTLHITFTVIRPTGIAVSTSIRNFNLGSLSGAFTDSAGNTGTAIIGGAAGGSGARPGPSSTLLPNSVSTGTIVDGAVTGAKIVDGAVGLAKINTAEVQRRVSGTCGVGSFIRQVNADGTVLCGSGSLTQSDEQSGLLFGLNNTCQDLTSLTFTAAPAGNVTCTGSARILMTHTSGGAASVVELDLTTASASCGNAQSLIDLPATYPSVSGQDFSVPLHRTFPVTAGTFSVFLTGRTLNSASADQLAHSITCTLTPQ